jgi:hypothetical protein
MAVGDGIYATKAEWLAYTDDGTAATPTLSDPNLEKLLAAAERDVDRYLRPYWTRIEGTTLLFGLPKTTNQQRLTAAQVAALSRITCARAEYRALKGSVFFAEDERSSVSGPDFNVSGKLDKIGPKVRDELRDSGLLTVRRRGIRATA